MSDERVGRASALLAVQGLTTQFLVADGKPLTAVDDVSFHVPAGASVGLVGESGSGKSVTALSLLRLIRPPGRISAGQVRFEDRDLLALSEKDMRAVRGDAIAMIFQEPMTALNPVMTTGKQVAETLVVHRGQSKKAALAATVELYKKVGIADPERRVHEFPHQLSGGMRQRVMIAMALACGPKLLVADEPTTALDVTIQAQILALLGDLRRELNMALLLITHDLGIVAESCDEVVVMYAGQVVEAAAVPALFAQPRHPYTAGLLRSIPSLSGAERLREIPGLVPRLGQMPSGCRFAPRCDRVQDRCRTEAPPLVELSPGRQVRCFFPIETT